MSLIAIASGNSIQRAWVTLGIWGQSRGLERALGRMASWSLQVGAVEALSCSPGTSCGGGGASALQAVSGTLGSLTVTACYHTVSSPFEGMDDKNASKLNELIQVG